MRTTTKAVIAVPLALSLALSTAGVAGAGDGDIRVAGRCSGSSEAKLQLSEENGHIEVEFEVDETRIGQTWRVAVRDNGVRVLRTRATTTAPSGSFEIRTVVDDDPGREVIRARARNLTTGETCRARARW